MRFRKQQPADRTAAAMLRPLLYGTVPMAEWPPPGGPGAGEPWATFVRARDAYGRGARAEAVQAWLSIARDPAVEARCALQAWTYLRAADVQPDPSEAQRVLGVVCEVGVRTGHDVLAVYRDGSARYLNQQGGASVVEEPWPETYAVLRAAEPLGAVVGLWDRPDLPPLPPEHTRMLLLTPGGFRFGQGPTQALFADPVAGSVLREALTLLQRIVGQG